MKAARAGWGTLLCACVALTCGRARAQMAPPTVSQLIVDPKDDLHIALRSSFGLLLSHDGGATWDWRSKAGMGYKGRAEPAVAILNGGAIVLGVATGALAGDRAGCDFRDASGIDAGVVDVAPLPETRGAALAVSVSFATSSSRVWQSLDAGKTFRPLGEALPHFTALSLRAAPASPQRVYMTGLRWGPSVEGAFAVSDDGGRTFAVAPLAGTDSGSQPFLAAIDPKRPDAVYVRLTGNPGRVRASADGGRTFREVLSVPAPLQAIALSPTGQTLIASSLEAGTYRGDAASLKFERAGCEGVPCLAWAGANLLACGEAGRHGFVVGRSVDEGRSFASVLDEAGIAPAQCGPATSVGATPARDWPRVSAAIARRAAEGESESRDGAEATRKPFGRSCLEDAERPSPERNTETSAASRAIPARVSRGCGCSSAPGGTSGRVVWIDVVLVFALIRRRRASMNHGIDEDRSRLGEYSTQTLSPPA